MSEPKRPKNTTVMVNKEGRVRKVKIDTNENNAKLGEI